MQSKYPGYDKLSTRRRVYDTPSLELVARLAVGYQLKNLHRSVTEEKVNDTPGVHQVGYFQVMGPVVRLLSVYAPTSWPSTGTIIPTTQNRSLP